MAQLRTTGRVGIDGTLEALQKIFPTIRERFGKHTDILVCGDSGCCLEPIMAGIKSQPNVHYILSLVRNSKLEPMPQPEFWQTATKLDEEAGLCLRASRAHATPELDGTARRRA